MANNRIVFDGLDELKRELRQLPETLRGAASSVVEGTAREAEHEVKAVYQSHEVTGALARGLGLSQFDAGKVAVGIVLKSRARHAWLFDNGSQTRQWRSGKSTGRMWGRSAPMHTFVSSVVRARKRMYQRLAMLLEQHGLKVSGTP